MSTETSEPNQVSPSLQIGLSMLGGLGITIMIVAGAIGAIAGANADAAQIGFLLILGAAMLISAIVAWAAIVRPFENFDDINVPLYHGHHEEHHADDTQESHH